MKVCVIGLGYIGLPTAAMFADSGCEVLGVDKKPSVVDALNRGEITIEEDGLAEFISRVAKGGKLRASLVPEASDAYIISVPTPITESKKADMSFVKSASEEVAPLLKRGDLVVLESTSPVGTVDGLMLPVLEEFSGLKAGRDFGLGHSPERVIPGNILHELVHNSRIAGGIDGQSAGRIAQLYRRFVKGEIYETDARTAEMCKLAENTFRDVNIAFANELAKICEHQGINVWELIDICNRHPRVNIHRPGPGVGGHCIAVDPWFIVEKEPELSRIISTSRQVNDSMPAYAAKKAMDIVSGISSPVICILGATYKPDVDDMRESPILRLAEELRSMGAEVRIQDPHAAGRPGIEADACEAARGADLVILGVDHRQYAKLDFKELASCVRTANFLDTRNFAGTRAAEEAGFACRLLGR